MGVDLTFGGMTVGLATLSEGVGIGLSTGETGDGDGDGDVIGVELKVDCEEGVSIITGFAIGVGVWGLTVREG